MRRRSLFFLLSVGALAACTPARVGSPAAAATTRPAVADDYWWFRLLPDLDNGFTFTWVRDLIPQQVLERLGGKELERVGWQQLVGSGDGQVGTPYRYFIGVARLEGWSLIVEDNSDLGVTESLVRPLSRGTTVVANHHGADGHGRFLLLDDTAVQLDFDPAAPGMLKGSRAAELAPMLTAVGFGADSDRNTRAAFALAERFTGTEMTQDLLRDRTYLLTAVPRS